MTTPAPSRSRGISVVSFLPLKRMHKHGKQPELNKPASSASHPFSNCYKSRAVKVA